MDPVYRHGGPDAGWYLRTMGGWRRISDTEAATERYEGMRHFMHDPDEDGEVMPSDPGSLCERDRSCPIDGLRVNAAHAGITRRRRVRRFLLWLLPARRVRIRHDQP
jgi:hypothetical protein